MPITTTAKIVRDGNSAAVRLPKRVLEASSLSDALTMEVSRGKITLRTAREARDGWAERIARVQASLPSTVVDSELTAWENTSTHYEDSRDQTL